MEAAEQKKMNEMRLSDRILFALNLAIYQRDIIIADMLSNALELAMTRNAGGQKFVERRDYSEEVMNAFQRLDELKKK